MPESERTPDSPQRGGNDSSNEDESGGRPQLSVWIYLAIFLALLVHLFWVLGSSEGNRIEYSRFLEYVQNGYVKEVTITNDNEITGKYVRSVPKDSVKMGEPQQDLLGRTSEGSRYEFTSTRPSDDNLIKVLQNYNQSKAVRQGDKAEISYDAAYEENWFGTILTWALPILLIIGLWIFFLRRMGPGSQVLNIGKSKANVTDAEEDHDTTFDDVAGLEEAKEEVVEVVEFLQNPEKFTKLGGELPKGVLLVGQPGTGKTLMARAVAGEAGVPFFSLSGSDFVEMFVGVGASRVRDLFKKAKEEAPCIVFIDEIDAIGRTRGRNQIMGGNDERENTLNQLLSEMDGFESDKGVIIMAATNRPDVLDSALMRPGRFDRQIMIDKPDRREREQIFEVHTQDLLLGENVNMEVLAGQTPGFAGAEIANVCNEAALLAARNDKDIIEMEDFESAIDRVIGGLEKKNKIIAPEERKVIAFHEAGHAIVGWFLEHTDPVVKVSIVPRGMAALGYSQSMPEERYLYSKQALLDRMAMMLGGRMAEEIIFGEVTTGAQNDLERITKMAYAMVVDYGMSEKIGNVSFNLSEQQEGAGESQPMFEKPYSDDTARLIDKEVKVIIDTVRNRARDLLEKERDKLDAMAETLLEEEVLRPEELVDILGPRPHGDYVSLNGQGNGQKEIKSGGEASEGVDAEGAASDRPDETASSGDGALEEPAPPNDGEDAGESASDAASSEQRSSS